MTTHSENSDSKPTLETILNHRSIRKFTKQPIDAATFEQLIEAGMAGSSSGFLQSASIIRVTDPERRYDIRRICADAQQAKDGEKYGHPYVEQCAELLIFCMDNHRHQTLVPNAQIDWTEVTIVGAVDAAIMAQNLLLAAESIGLGGVYLGSIRNDIRRMGDILKLPQGVVPLFGMALGYPDQNPAMRPRLPKALVVSTNQYEPADKSALDQYNQTVADYYAARGQAGSDWLQTIESYLDKPVRPEVLPYLNQQGYAKK